MSKLMKVSALILPLAMGTALAVRFSTESQSGYKLVGATFLFALICWLARFQWRRSLDQEAVFFNARVLPTDSEATKLSADVVSLVAGILTVGAILLNVI